ncbi:MAG: phenylpropionate dioxygenase-like ring-hydroxylating dioxygenase large terminal subunit [Candidatus Azotimanducaceae bacterium]|jgi:phenylpropionate dioxygenase-like ring-hydroxylating dioxygenase large terminal subunit
MTTSLEERNIIKTVLEYSDSGETQLQPNVMLTPVARYTEPSRLKLEMATLFREFPLVLGHVSQLQEAGNFFTHNDTGVPILVTRSRTGTVKAFINVCRHRGARVVNESCGLANTFSCPYHGWTYDLDGNFRGMRQAEGFGDIDKSTNGLVELPVFERFGLIWVRPSPSEKELDIDSWLAPMEEQLGSLSLTTHTVFREWSLPRDMNWRIALEGFLETYHFCSAHKNTACSAYLDNQSPFLDKYPHVRNAVPLARITKLKDQDPESWQYRPNFMTQNYLFPCNFLQVMTDHVFVHTIIPTGQDTCVFKCLMLIPEVAETEKAQKYYEANYNVVRQVFDEDFEIGEGIQAGLATGVNENFTIGRYEAGLQLAQVAMDDALEGRLRVKAVSTEDL